MGGGMSVNKTGKAQSTGKTPKTNQQSGKMGNGRAVSTSPSGPEVLKSGVVANIDGKNMKVANIVVHDDAEFATMAKSQTANASNYMAVVSLKDEVSKKITELEAKEAILDHDLTIIERVIVREKRIEDGNQKLAIIQKEIEDIENERAVIAKEREEIAKEKAENNKRIAEDEAKIAALRAKIAAKKAAQQGTVTVQQ